MTSHRRSLRTQAPAAQFFVSTAAPAAPLRNSLPALSAAALGVLLFTAAPADAAPARRASPAAIGSAGAHNYAARNEVREFIQSMVDSHGFDADDLTRAFRAARHDSNVLRLIAPPRAGFKRSWETYRARFLDPLRIREGVRFWQTHQDDIERASAEYGVPM